MNTPTLWKITCMENEYPGLWYLWFKNQCVTDGHSPYDGEKKCFLNRGNRNGERDWSVTRNALKKINPEDVIVVALPGRRIGRIGKVLDKKIEDEEWDALVPGDSEWKRG